MRILQVVDSLAAGGLERVAVELACGLQALGHEAFLCVTRAGGPLEELLPEELGVLRLRRRSRWDFRAVRQLRNYVRRHGIEVVHAHGSSVFISAVALAGSDDPMLIWHDHFGDLHGQGRNRWLYRLAALRIDGIIPVSEELAQWARVFLPIKDERIRIIKNGVGEMRPQRGKSAMVLNGPRGKRVVCVANFRRQKDHTTLIRAFSSVAINVPDSRLFLVGATDDTEYMQEVQNVVSGSMVSDRIEILGGCSDIPWLLDRMDVGVLASRSEGLPLALLEYGMAGLGVVVTSVGDVPAVVINEESGFVVAPGDAEGFAEALKRVLEDPINRTRMGQTLKENVSSRFGMGQMVREVLSFYEDVMSAKNSYQVSGRSSF